ncbi:hypothetical protein LPJ66_002309 [Kickxella alabastrina]|uniref:Uncharacterized protein n=1 Tax=Kickxella alabastrina TaxID=61397 RepID=A0ACC1IQS5_9FUNG|nr:hypothetical protein LPJ66_002309 [Kickxella alabastrina]
MNSEHRSAARLLSTSAAPNIVAEITHDVLTRWSAEHTQTQIQSQGDPALAAMLSGTQQLMRLGQYITTFRVRSDREQLRRQAEYDRQQVRNIVDSTAHLVAGGFRMLLGRAAGGKSGGALSAVDAGALEAIAAAAEHLIVGGGDPAATVAGLALVGGVVLALRLEAVADVAAERVWAAFVRLAKAAIRQCAGRNWLRAALAVCVEAAPQGEHLRGLAEDGCVLGAFTQLVFDPQSDYLVRVPGHAAELEPEPEHAVGLVSALATAASTRFPDVLRLVQLVHANATDVLVSAEHSRNQPGRATAAGLRTLAILHVLDAVLQRYFVDDAYLGVAEGDLVDAWCAVVDSLAAVHFVTLRLGGRAGTEAFRRASTMAVRFISSCSAPAVDAAVRRVFGAQPCLCFMAQRPVSAIGGERSCLVLFYMDLCEHLVPLISANSVATLVLPLAARYAGGEVVRDVGAEWFESAHALVLAVLEAGTANGAVQRVGMEAVPWYSGLVLRLYPDQGISANLLRIAFTASVRCLAAIADGDLAGVARLLAWDCVSMLLGRIDAIASDGHRPTPGRVRAEVNAVRRRELLLVLADQVAAVPLALLPRLLAEIHPRVVKNHRYRPGSGDCGRI